MHRSAELGRKSGCYVAVQFVPITEALNVAEKNGAVVWQECSIHTGHKVVHALSSVNSLSQGGLNQPYISFRV